MRHARVFLLAGLIVTALILPMLPCTAQASMEWSGLKQLGVEKEPLDVATSEDGRFVFVLVSGEVLAYSVPDYKLTDRIPVEANFDRLVLGKNNTLLLTSRSKKELRVIQLTFRHSFDLAGLAVKGPADAPVLIAIFSDYQ